MVDVDVRLLRGFRYYKMGSAPGGMRQWLPLQSKLGCCNVQICLKILTFYKITNID